jgi:RimJ/RimL family protein N-acetyltransferase
MTQATVHDEGRPLALRKSIPPVRASERYWGITWEPSEHNGVLAQPVEFEALEPFMIAHYAQLFAAEPHRFFEEKMTPAKRRYLAESDSFLFKKDGVEVGVCVNSVTDWGSYYLRTYALLPEARGLDFSLSFLHHVFTRLKAVGVVRVEADTSPTNIAVHRVFTALGMVVTNTVSSDRWGLMLRFTGFLDAAADRAFRSQFLQSPGVPRECPSPLKIKKGVGQ